MALKTRIEKAEKAARPKRTALFIISEGKASGSAWWNDRLKWANLTRPEHEQLTADLASEGVEIINLDIIVAHAKGQGVNGWGQAVKL